MRTSPLCTPPPRPQTKHSAALPALKVSIVRDGKGGLSTHVDALTPLVVQPRQSQHAARDNYGAPVPGSQHARPLTRRTQQCAPCSLPPLRVDLSPPRASRPSSAARRPLIWPSALPATNTLRATRRSLHAGRPLSAARLLAARCSFPPPPAGRQLLLAPVPATCLRAEEQPIFDSRPPPPPRYSGPRPLPARRRPCTRRAILVTCASRRALLMLATCRPSLAACRPCGCRTARCTCTPYRTLTPATRVPAFFTGPALAGRCLMPAARRSPPPPAARRCPSSAARCPPLTTHCPPPLAGLSGRLPHASQFTEERTSVICHAALWSTCQRHWSLRTQAPADSANTAVKAAQGPSLFTMVVALQDSPADLQVTKEMAEGRVGGGHKLGINYMDFIKIKGA
ncbi:hypothetical protein GGX14DRAFT_572680 [Mycena pura]|uniref:Uncharacterized protein n=1 Tax=Mycena pura TaxID=153505 RepID=A0AAD6V813_9AGAR|nr:hypothetical protein GGX14DRAFT_572680 [Mycena pura]